MAFWRRGLFQEETDPMSIFWLSEVVNTSSRTCNRMRISLLCHRLTERYALLGLVDLGYDGNRDHSTQTPDIVGACSLDLV